MPKKINKTKRKKSLKYKLSDKKYKELIKKKKINLLIEIKIIY